MSVHSDTYYCLTCEGIHMPDAGPVDCPDLAMDEDDGLGIRDGIDCPRCGIELGEGSGKCQRAKGSDICLSCAVDMDGIRE